MSGIALQILILAGVILGTIPLLGYPLIFFGVLGVRLPKRKTWYPMLFLLLAFSAVLVYPVVWYLGLQLSLLSYAGNRYLEALVFSLFAPFTVIATCIVAKAEEKLVDKLLVVVASK